MIPLKTASPHPVSHVVFSPDGGRVAVAQPFSGVTVIERATGREVAVCAMPRRAWLTGLAFCGEYLAAAHAKGFEVFHAETGRSVLSTHKWYRKGLLLAARGGSILGVLPADYVAVTEVAAVGSAGVSDDIDNEKSLFDRSHARPVGYSPDGRFLLTTDGGSRCVLWDTAADRSAAEVERPAGRGGATFCPLGRRFAIGDGHTLDVYDAGELAAEVEEEQPADTPLVQRANVACGRDGRDATTTGDSVAVAPMPHTLLEPAFVLKPEKPADAGAWFPPFALAADGRGVLVRRPRNRVQLWDAPTGALLNEWSWGFEWVTCVAVSTDGFTAVAGGRFGRVLLWDLD